MSYVFVNIIILFNTIKWNVIVVEQDLIAEQIHAVYNMRQVYVCASVVRPAYSPFAEGICLVRANPVKRCHATVMKNIFIIYYFIALI